jgi:acyl carrier protein
VIANYYIRSKISPKSVDSVLNTLLSILTISQLTEASHFSNDLGLDSLDTVEVVMAIEEACHSVQY